MTHTLDYPTQTLPRPAAEYGAQTYYDDGRAASDRGRTETPGIDQLRFWIGAVLAATITGVLGGLGILVAGAIIHVPVLVGAAAVSAVSYAVVTGFIALAVAGLYDAMLHVAPRPTVYFGWLVGAAALVAAVLPFTAGVTLGSAIAFAAVNLIVGLVVVCLLPMAVVPRS